MKNRSLIFLMLILLVVSACSESPEFNDRVASAEFMAQQKARFPNLAYEHNFSVKVDRDDLRARYEATLAQCIELAAQRCMIIHSTIKADDGYSMAEVQLRVQGEGVEPLIKTAAEGGEIVSEDVQAEDLTESIADIQGRLAMLESFRDKLLKLEDRADQDIESLIKITQELAQVQADIERALGSSASMERRIALDLVVISFQTESRYSSWGQISEALREFADNLAEAIAGVITAVAYLLPWLILIVALFLLSRWLWRWLRVKGK